MLRNLPLTEADDGRQSLEEARRREGWRGSCILKCRKKGARGENCGRGEETAARRGGVGFSDGSAE